MTFSNNNENQKIDKKSLHWAEQLAEKIKIQKKEEYLISGGMTTSGPAHLGTLCEFLFPSTIYEELKRQNKKVKFYFFADIFDAFDSIPSIMKEYEEQLTPHLGKPLCFVPDPTKKSVSFGDHFLDEAKKLMKEFQIDVKIIRINEVYEEGLFDEHLRFYIKNDDLVKKEILKSSFKEKLDDFWAPFMPICKNCQKIATTKVLNYNLNEYEYVCDKDVGYTKGCGFRGKNKIEDHKYKIIWRLHWPTWLDYFNTSCEGAGVDHHTKGGSWSTVLKIFKNVLKKEPPIGFKYGFVLFQGKKYSKSKGIGMSVSEIIKLVPPEILKFLLTKSDLQENKDIDPTNTVLLKLIDSYVNASLNSKKDIDTLSRADRKDVMSFLLTNKKMKWKVNFLDIIIYYQIYQDFKKVGELLNDKEGVEYLKPYVLEWINKNYVPLAYSFKYTPNKNCQKIVKDLFNEINESFTDKDIQNKIYSFSKEKNIEVNEFFKTIYNSILNKEKGPRLGKLIKAIGVNRIKKDLRCDND